MNEEYHLRLDARRCVFHMTSLIGKETAQSGYRGIFLTCVREPLDKLAQCIRVNGEMHDALDVAYQRHPESQV
jgi:hypothetical protein